MLQQIILTNRQINIIKKLSIKMSKGIKLSKYYQLKKSKSYEIISFVYIYRCPLENQKRKKAALKSSFRTRRSSFPVRNPQKRPEYDNFGLFKQPSIISLYKKSSLYFKIVDFLLKTIATFVFKTWNLSKLYI